MRSLKRIAALSVPVVGLMLLVAPIASAHHPVITATVACDGTVSYTVVADELNASRDNNDITVTDTSGLPQPIEVGVFDAADDWSFSGSFVLPAGVFTDTLTATPLGVWGDGSFDATNTSSVTVTRPTDCASLSTSATNPATVGSQIHDVATLSGATDATGAVTFQVFAPSDPSCTTPLETLATASANVDANGDGTYTSAGFTANAIGVFHWRAFFAGDSDNDPISGTCGAMNESSMVNQATPAISTQASGPVTVGQQITDTATLSGAVGATGKVTFEVFPPGDSTCSTTPTVLQTQSDSVDSNGNGTYTSAPYTTTTAGTYRWIAVFAGDVDNAAVSGTCNAMNESSMVNQATPAISTQASGPVTVGQQITDTATLSGAVGATGKVTFEVFPPGDSTCSTTPTVLQTQSDSVDSNGNGTYTSAPYTTTTAGTYRWIALFAGDAKNAAVSGACNATGESSTVNSPPPVPASPSISITKNPKSQTIPSGGTATFTIVVTNTGNVTLAPVTVSDPLTPGCNASSSSIPALASMAPGATVTYNCSLADVTASFTNSATATGTPPSGSNVTATDTAPVTVTPPPSPPAPTPPAPAVTHPAISIVKDPKSQTIAVGGTATFEITVTNTGDVSLSDVTVTDTLSPDCDRKIGTLAAGGSTNYSCTRKNVTADFENVADVSGQPPTGSPVKASDHADVSVAAFVPPSHPAIAIVKSPKEQTLVTTVSSERATSGVTTTTVHFGTAEFTIKVTNIGNVTLHDVVVSDPESTGCGRALGTLSPGASRSYACSRATVTHNFTNVATATGVAPNGKKVSDEDHADVRVKTKTTATLGVTKGKSGVKPGSSGIKPGSTGTVTTGTGTPQFTG